MAKHILLTAVFLFTGIISGAIRDNLVLEKQMQSTISGSHWSCCYFAVFSESIETYNGYQYVAFYDQQGKVCVGRRAVKDTLWDTLQIQGYTTNTSNGHNTAAIGICRGDGTIHLSFDYHCAPINYSVSVKRLASVPDSFAWHGNLFGPVGSNAPFGLGAHSSVSYPYFVSVPDGRLQFFFRDGCCAHGDRVLYEYSPLTGAWISVGILFSRYNSISFTGEDAMYPNGYTYDKNNRLHITWCWRLDADCCNRDLCYAYSDDFGRTWYSSTGRLAGKANTSPINEDSTQVTVWNIPTGRGYINQCGQALDSKGRIHVVTWHVPDSASNTSDFYPPNAKYFHYWREIDGTWHRDELSTVPVAYRPHLIFDEFDNLFLFTAQTTIYGASADSGWRDWTLLFNEKTDIGAPGGGEFHEPTIDIGGWESSGILSTVSASLKVTDINIAYSSFQKLLVKVYSSSDSAILKGFNIRVLRNDTLRGHFVSDGRGSKLLYLKPSIYNLILSEIGFSPETLMHVDLTNTLIDTHRVAAYLSPLPVIGLKIAPDSLVLPTNRTDALQAFTVFEGGRIHTMAGLIWSSLHAGLFTVDTSGHITTGSDTGWGKVVCRSVVTGFADTSLVHVYYIKNRALIATATASSYSLQYFVNKVNDGKATTDFDCWTNQSGQYPAWVQLDFGETTTFNRVEMYTVSGYELQSYTIQYRDGTSWVDAASVNGNTQTHRSTVFSPVTCTSMRVYMTTGAAIQPQYARICELEIYKDDGGTGLEEEDVQKEEMSLSVYPSPFNPATSIRYNIPGKSVGVELTIYDAIGRFIRNLPVKSGSNTVIWDGSDNSGGKVSSGVYIVRLKAGKQIIQRTGLFVK